MMERERERERERVEGRTGGEVPKVLEEKEE